MGLILGLLAALVAGLAMVEMGFTDPDLELPSRIFAIICGIIMILPGLIMIPPFLTDMRKKRMENRMAGKPVSLLRFLSFQSRTEIAEELSERADRLGEFFQSYTNFFETAYRVENSELQKNATQLYWSFANLHKRRLDSKGLRMRFVFRRIRFGDYPDYSEQAYSDEKFEITQVAETLEACKEFYKDNRKIGRDKCSQLAGITLLVPKHSSKGTICCPNCGGISTRENLIDGCDYCKTKFTIEDLEESVSAFSFSPDYDLEYAKYCDTRSRFSLWVGLIVGIPIGIFSLIGAIGALLNGAAEGSGPFMMLCASLFTVVFVTFAAIFFSLLFFYFCIFPIIQLVASLIHVTHRHLDVLKQVAQSDREKETEIQKHDPLFSLDWFYSDMSNKLATVFYGNTDDEMLAFSEGKEAEDEILSVREYVRDVINVSTDWMRIASFGNDNGAFRMIVEGALTVTRERNGRLKRENRNIRLQVSKDEKCRTKAVSAPSFIKCPGCGNSLSILSGKKCEYCGRIRDLSSVDWAITRFGLYR